MPLIKVCRSVDIAEGQKVIKESYDSTLIITRRNGKLICVEVPDVTYSQSDYPESVPGARIQQLYEDSDNLVWVQYVQQHKPIVDKKQPGFQGFGMGSFLESGPQAPPLLPFAGYNMVPLPPSPAKPQQDVMQAEAVTKKSWGNRQASIKQFFSTTTDF